MDKEITRIDVTRNPNGDGCLVQKWLDGWKAGQAPYEQYQSEWTIEQVYQWLMEDHDWFIARWPLDPGIAPVGLRAFLGPNPAPVRTAAAIKRMRSTLQRDISYYRQLGIEPSAYNLAFYL